MMRHLYSIPLAWNVSGNQNAATTNTADAYQLPETSSAVMGAQPGLSSDLSASATTEVSTMNVSGVEHEEHETVGPAVAVGTKKVERWTIGDEILPSFACLSHKGWW